MSVENKNERISIRMNDEKTSVLKKNKRISV